MRENWRILETRKMDIKIITMMEEAQYFDKCNTIDGLDNAIKMKKHKLKSFYAFE